MSRWKKHRDIVITLFFIANFFFIFFLTSFSRIEMIIGIKVAGSELLKD
jgi:hypothetical protein